MKISRRITTIICIVLSAAVMSACSFPHVNLNRASDVKSRSDITSLGLSPEFSYKVPSSSPNIEVDRLGYKTSEKKRAVFKANKP